LIDSDVVIPVFHDNVTTTLIIVIVIKRDNDAITRISVKKSPTERLSSKAHFTRGQIEANRLSASPYARVITKPQSGPFRRETLA